MLLRGGGAIAGLGAGFAALTLIAGVGTAVAAPAWTFPQAWGDGGSSPTLRSAVGVGGTVAGIWTRNVSGDIRALAQVRPPGGPLGPVETLSPAGVDVTAPQIGVDGAGGLVAIWRQNLSILATFRPAGGAWSTPVKISPDGKSADVASLAVAPSGEAVAAWVDPGPVDSCVRASIRPVGGAFGATPCVSLPTPDIAAPAVAIGADGTALAGFTRSNDALVARRGPGGAFAAGVALTESVNFSALPGSVDVAVGPQGDSVAAFLAEDPPNEELRAAVRAAAGGSWDNGSGPLGTADLSALDSFPAAAIDGQGTSHVAWYDLNDIFMSRISVRSRRAGGGFTAAQHLGSGVAPGGPGIAGLPAGGAVLVFGQGTDLRGTVRPPTAGLGEPSFAPHVRVGAGPVSGRPQLHADGAGDVGAAWLTDLSLPYLAAHDAAGPTIAALGPASGAPGQPLPFSVTVRDTWSPLGATTWSFGDGASDATGEMVTRAFPSAGLFPVTVTARDALGNSATAATQATVTAPPPIPPVVIADRTAPAVSALRVSPSRFRPGSKATARSALIVGRARVGTTVSFRLSERADVTLTIRRRSGVRIGAAGGTLRRRALAAGAVRIRFSGRVGRSALAPGYYRLSVVARDAAGNRSKARTANFTLAER